ncbi:MAG: helix-turn-helix transcriptional regulator [Gammaproteobacteria bacterium]|nr:helix-turn-helix transcriptional regulator [Gammaproteobacteria bacterium]
MSNYQTNIQCQADRFKALSNPHRLALYQRLCTCCTPSTACTPDEATRFCVGDLGEGLDIAPSTLSHHLKELHRAGLIAMQRNGKNVECWVETDTLQEMIGFFHTNLTIKD